MKKIVSFFAERSLLVNLLSFAILIAGLMFIFTAQREAFPNVEFDFVIINTVYPGSTAEDVEKHISIPIEKELREVDGIDELFSTSLESRSVVSVKLDPNLDNKDKTVNDIKNAIDKVKDLPEDAEDPEVVELGTHQQPVLEIAIRNTKGLKNDADEFELRKYTKRLEDRILELKGVARVDKRGYRDREMIIEVIPGKLDEFHVAINDVIVALSKKNLNFPGGVIKNKDGEILIRTIGEIQNLRELRNVLIRANDMGNWVRVGDVARVKDSFEEEKIINMAKSRKAIMITVIKKESADIIEMVDRVTAEIGRYKKMVPDYIEMEQYNDMSVFVKRRLGVLVNNGIVGFILVVLSLFITLGWRIALVTALGIPLAFFGTFVWMSSVEMSINLISMFGLIMVLGMIVDDAIIVAENIYRHLEMGSSIGEAVITGAGEVIVPVGGTILTTIAAFSPLMYMTGIMGKFIWALPAVVTVSLIASWVECMFILPAHIKDIEGLSSSATNKHTAKDRKILNFFKSRYEKMLTAVLNRRYIFVICLLLFSVLTIGFAKNFVKFILFPQGNIEILVVKAEASTKTAVKEMSNKLEKLEKVIARISKQEMNIYTSRAGIIREDPNDPHTKRGSNYGIIKLYLTPRANRDRSAVEIMDWLRKETKHINNAEFKKVEFKTVRTGPPVGKAISVNIKGDEFPVLEKIADEFKKHLKTIKGLKDITDDFEEGKEERRVIINEKTAAIAGISVFDVASTVRSCYEGTVATTIKRTDEEIDLRVIFPERLRNSIDSLGKVKVANRLGNLIPLSSIARFEKGRSISTIYRKDWRRSITVMSDIDERAKGVTSVIVNMNLMKKFSNIEERYPGYTVSYKGEFKDTEESMTNLLKSFIIAALAIYIILVTLFQSMGHPLVIMSVIPFTFLGVVWIFFFHGEPLSFLAIMGVVGLTGVVVNDSIVLVDFIRKGRRKGLPVVEAAIEAGVTRLRPVFLTTITTFFGLIPTAYGWGGFDPFLVPMAISLSWGLMFGTTVTLFVTPAFYTLFSDFRRKISGRNGERYWHKYYVGSEKKEDVQSIEEPLSEHYFPESEEELPKTEKKVKKAAKKSKKPSAKRKKKE